MPEKRTIQKDDLYRLKFLQSAALSPDGKRLVYGVSGIDTEKDQQTVALWMLAVDSGEARQFTNGTAQDNNPAWSPDGKMIAFMSTRGGAPQIYLIPADGGEARQLTHLKQGVGGGPVWSPDGKHIAFTAGPQVDSPPDPSRPFRVDRHVYRFDALGYLDPVIQDIYVISALGGDPRRLTNDRAMNTNPLWSPDGREILYSASMLPDRHDGFLGRMRIVNVIDGSIHEIPKHTNFGPAFTWMPDGQRVVTVTTAAIGSKGDLLIVDRHTGKAENRTASFATGVGGGLQPDMPMGLLYNEPAAVVTKDGKTAYVPAQIGGTIHIYRVALEGPERVEPVLTGDRACMLLGLSSDERSILYGISDFNVPGQVYLADIEGGNEKQLTHLNEDFLAGIALPTVERLLFPGSDGVQVEGWAIKPAVGKAPYPTVLYIHGGPYGAFGHIYHFDTQMLCGAGYAVLMVNHRASTGYGDAFSLAIKQDWGNLDYKDLMAGVDYAIEKGIADPDKLGVCGLSGGGNLSTWIVGQTDRFKAAVPENPVTNWFSMYGVSDLGVWFALEEMGGHPWEVPEIYEKCSPITYAHNCKTPTLLIQGEHDWRCPAEQSEQFYAHLKANGCIVEMLRLPNSPHGGAIAGPLASRRAQNDALLDWMNRYVLGKPPERDIV